MDTRVRPAYDAEYSAALHRYNIKLPCRFRLAPPRGQNVFRVAVRLFAALEDEVAGGLEGDTVEIRRHRAVQRIAGVLLVDHHRHALERLHHLLFGDDAMLQPVRQMLTGDA